MVGFPWKSALCNALMVYFISYIFKDEKMKTENNYNKSKIFKTKIEVFIWNTKTFLEQYLR